LELDFLDINTVGLVFFNCTMNEDAAVNRVEMKNKIAVTSKHG